MAAPACVLVALAACFALHVMHPFSGMHVPSWLMLPSPAQAQAGSEAASDAAHSKQEASESDTSPVGSNDPCACPPMVLPHAACTMHTCGGPQKFRFDICTGQ